MPESSEWPNDLPPGAPTLPSLPKMMSHGDDMMHLWKPTVFVDFRKTTDFALDFCWFPFQQISTAGHLAV